MKVSVSSYSFSKLMNQGILNQFSCIEKAKEIGFDGIEFVNIMPHDGSTIEEYAVKLKEECKRIGITITNYTFGADFINGSNGDVTEEIQRVKEQIDIADILGAYSVRHDATIGYSKKEKKHRGFQHALPILANACREITEYAAQKKIVTMVENHGTFCQDSDRMEALVNAVDHENFGWLCDMGNFLCVDENPIHAVGKAAPYVKYVHVKDFYVKSGNEPDPGDGFFRSRGGNYLKGTIVGHGNIPVTQCLAILKNAGYDGYVAIEFEGMEDTITALSIGVSNLKRYIASIS